MADVVGPRLYSCCNCRNHVALHDDVISKAFQFFAGGDAFGVRQALAVRPVGLHGISLRDIS